MMLIIFLLALLLPTVAPFPKVPVTPVMNYVPDLPPTYSITYQFLFYNETKIRQMAAHQTKLITNEISDCCTLQPSLLKNETQQSLQVAKPVEKQENLKKQPDQNKKSQIQQGNNQNQLQHKQKQNQQTQKNEAAGSEQKQKQELINQQQKNVKQKEQKQPQHIQIKPVQEVEPKNQNNNPADSNKQKKDPVVAPKEISKERIQTKRQRHKSAMQIAEQSSWQQGQINWGMNFLLLISIAVLYFIADYAIKYYNPPQTFAPISQSSRHQIQSNRLEID